MYYLFYLRNQHLYERTLVGKILLHGTAFHLQNLTPQVHHGNAGNKFVNMYSYHIPVRFIYRIGNRTASHTAGFHLVAADQMQLFQLLQYFFNRHEGKSRHRRKACFGGGFIFSDIIQYRPSVKIFQLNLVCLLSHPPTPFYPDGGGKESLPSAAPSQILLFPLSPENTA